MRPTKHSLKLPEEFSEHLHATISSLIWHRDRDKIISFKDKVHLTNSLKEFLVGSIDKFISGQQEHGGELIKRDLNVEISQEIIDLFWYNEFLKLKNKTL